MLTYLSKQQARSFTVPVNGIKLEAKDGETIMELCDRNHIKIPRLCHHPNLPPKASCRVCLIECNNSWFSAACVTPVYNGLSVNTKSNKVRDAVKQNLGMLLESHDERCTSCVAAERCQFRDLTDDFGVTARIRRKPEPKCIDNSTHSIRFDPGKCVLCGRCIRACESIVGSKSIHFANRGNRMVVQPTAGVTLEKSTCIKCGQCTLYCPVGAMTEKSQAQEVLEELRKVSKNEKVCIIEKSSLVDIAQALGYQKGVINAGQVIAALKALGFSMVVDASVGNDILIDLEAENLVKMLKNSKAKFPVYASNCSGFVNFVEQSHASIMKQLSANRSSAAIISGLIKNQDTKPKELPDGSEQIYTVYIGSCTAKKDEIKRPELAADGLRNTDVALTTRELVQMIKSARIQVHKLGECNFDHVYGEATGDGSLAYVTGGLAESVARATYHKMTGKVLPAIEFKELLGYKSVRVADVKIGAKVVKFAAVDQIHDALDLINKIEKKDPSVSDIKYVEVTACPGGCVAGGGSAYPENGETIQKRINEIYSIKNNAFYRDNSESYAVKNLPLGEVQELLQATFKARPKK